MKDPRNGLAVAFLSITLVALLVGLVGMGDAVAKPGINATTELVYLGHVPIEATGIAIQGDMAYVTTGRSNTLAIYDISVPAVPSAQGTFDAGDGAWDVIVQGDYAYVHTWSYFIAVDVSDPDAPVMADRLEFGSSDVATGMFADGPYIYLSRTDNNLYRIDVSNPHDLQWDWGYLGSYYAWDGMARNNIGYLVSAVFQGGLEIVALDTFPNSPEPAITRLGGLPTAALSYGIELVYPHLYVGDLDALRTVDVSAPATPLEVDVDEGFGFIVGLHAADNLLLITEKYGRVSLFTKVDPAAPQAVDSFSLPGNGHVSREIATTDAAIYVTAGGDGLYIFTLDPAETDVHPIDNPDGDGAFFVTWNNAPGHTRFELQERPATGQWQSIWSMDPMPGATTSKAIAGRAPGTWCYRVADKWRALYSEWSPEQCTTVQATTCYSLTRAHSGQGSDPTANPANSTGCATGHYTAGQAITLTASPANGWRVKNWSGTANDGSMAATNSLIMPAADHTAGVTYEQLPVMTHYLFAPAVLYRPATCFPGPNEQEPNDNKQEADGPLCNGQTYHGLPNDNYDVFYFDMAAAGPIAVVLNDFTAAGGQLVLLSTDFAVIASDQNPADGFRINRANEDAGRYYVSIHTPAPDVGAGTYGLRVMWE